MAQLTADDSLTRISHHA